MTAYDSFWQLLIASDSLWQLMTAYDSLWQLMTAYDNLWQLMTTYDNLWQRLTTYDNVWQLMTLFDNVWQLMTTFDNFWHWCIVCSVNWAAPKTSSQGLFCLQNKFTWMLDRYVLIWGINFHIYKIQNTVNNVCYVYHCIMAACTLHKMPLWWNWSMILSQCKYVSNNVKYSTGHASFLGQLYDNK